MTSVMGNIAARLHCTRLHQGHESNISKPGSSGDSIKWQILRLFNVAYSLNLNYSLNFVMVSSLETAHFLLRGRTNLSQAFSYFSDYIASVPHHV